MALFSPGSIGNLITNLDNDDVSCSHRTSSFVLIICLTCTVHSCFYWASSLALAKVYAG